MKSLRAWGIIGLGLAFALAVSTRVKADTVHVFLFAGQSNMWGYAPSDLLTPVPIWAQTPANGWEGHPFWSSDDDVIYPNPVAAGYNIALNNTYDVVGAIKPFGSDDLFGPEISLTELIQNAYPTWNIAVVKFAVGGTDLASDWNPFLASTGNVYSQFIQHVQAMDADIRAAGNTPVYEGLLWWQGEAALKTWDYLYPVPAFGAPLDPINGQRYEDYLYRFLLAVRQDVGTISQNTQPNLPTVIFRISASMMAANIINPQVVPGNPIFTYDVLQATVVERRTEQVFVANTVPNCTWTDTDNLPVQQQGDPAYWYHFTGDGYLAAGERGYASLAALKGWPAANSNPAPSNLVATLGGGQVTLSWNSLTAQYNVKRSLVSGGPYTTIAGGISIPGYTDRNLQNGVTYYYVVTAVNNVGVESANSNEASATPEPNLTALTLNSSSVAGGGSVTGSVTLDTAAPSGGAVVSLGSGGSAASVPASVTVPAGQTSASFTVSTQSVAASTSVTLTAAYLSNTQTAALTVQAATQASLSSLAVNPTSVTGGATTTGAVILTIAAPAGGATVSLSSGGSAASVPASVTVPAGQTSASFTVSTQSVAASTSVTLTAAYLSNTQTAALTVQAAAQTSLSSLSVNPTGVTGGSTAIGTVTLTSVAPAGGVTVSLSSGNAAASVPASVTVQAGSKTATFTISTSAVTVTLNVTLSAKLAGSTQSATLQVRAPYLVGVTMSPSTVKGGKLTTATLTLSGPAPAGGISVSVSTTNTAATSVPASVTIAAGQTSANFSIVTYAVASTTAVTINTTIPGSGRVEPGTMSVTP